MKFLQTVIDMNGYIGEFTIKNLTVGAVITIDAPAVENADINSQDFPYVSVAQSGEKTFRYSLPYDIFCGDTKSLINFPITIKNDGVVPNCMGRLTIQNVQSSNRGMALILAINFGVPLTCQTIFGMSVNNPTVPEFGIENVIFTFRDSQNQQPVALGNNIVTTLNGVEISSEIKSNPEMM